MVRKMAASLLALLLASGAGAQEPFVPVTDSARSFVSQGEFERFMHCYGRMTASLDLLERIRPMVGEPDQLDDIRRQGILLMNETFAAPYERLVDPGLGLDLFDGERARAEGRRAFDSLAGTGLDVQYERFRKEGAVSQDCLGIAADLAGTSASRAN